LEILPLILIYCKWQRWGIHRVGGWGVGRWLPQSLKVSRIEKCERKI